MNDLNAAILAQQRLVAALRDPRCYPHPVADVQVIETHISWVLLAGEFAYKIKKAVNLGFLDYAALDARRFYCGEEVRLNRRTAPEIYLDAVAIGGSPDQPAFGGQPAVEYAVRMRRFPPADLMDTLLMQGRVTPRHIDALSASIARFHELLPAAESHSVFGTVASIHGAAQQNFVALREHLHGRADLELVAALEADSEAEFAACRDVFERRHAHGFVRECHGDLHLGNIALIEDVPVPFDCLEFSPALRWIDVMGELAFTVMDLLHRDHADYAWRLLNACLEYSGDYGGIAVLRFYLAYRAAVRAKVCAIRTGQEGLSPQRRAQELGACRSYLALAGRCLRQRQPALIITHGLPGSGKTTFSQFALQQLGAIRIRSDVERKRLFGLGALERSRQSVGDIYTADATQLTYTRLLDLARELLASGYPVIVDAAFLKQGEREAFRVLAQGMALPFVIASLQAGDEVLQERLRLRRDDASEADVAVLEKLRTAQQPLDTQEQLRSACFTTAEAPDSEANAAAWRRLLELLR